MSIESIQARIQSASERLAKAIAKERAGRREKEQTIEQIRKLQKQLDDAEYSKRKQWDD